MIEVGVLGVALRGPGLDGWEAARPVLAGAAPYEAREVVLPPPAVLAPTERRRTGPVVRLALLVAQEASAMAGAAPGSLRCVFGSANGDGIVVCAILEALAATGPEAYVSPTQFHNSVHNAAAGYWSIGTGSAQPATVLGCHDSTFAASLLKAAAEVHAEGQPVLLCLYDVPLPEPLGRLRPTCAPFGAGLVLAPPGEGGMWRLRVGHDPAPPDPGADLPRDPALHPLARGNPAARALRLLEVLARGGADEVHVPYLDGRLTVAVLP